MSFPNFTSEQLKMMDRMSALLKNIVIAVTGIRFAMEQEQVYRTEILRHNIPRPDLHRARTFIELWKIEVHSLTNMEYRDIQMDCQDGGLR